MFYKTGEIFYVIGFANRDYAQEIKMIERALHAMFLCYAQGLFHGLLESKKLSLYRLLKGNLLLLQLVLVKMLG